MSVLHQAMRFGMGCAAFGALLAINNTPTVLASGGGDSGCYKMGEACLHPCVTGSVTICETGWQPTDSFGVRSTLQVGSLLRCTIYHGAFPAFCSSIPGDNPNFIHLPCDTIPGQGDCCLALADQHFTFPTQNVTIGPGGQLDYCLILPGQGL